MSKHISTRRESRNGASVDRIARLPSGSLPLHRTWPISLCIGLAIGSIAVSPDAFAGGPTGGTVVGGTGSITQNGNETVINQISQRLALNWETFNLKANESVLFNQPGRSAVALNRILDQNPSQIFGKINSNGQVFLINTHGIIFGATAQMNVGGLMASTLDLTPKDFLAGNYSLNAVGAGAGIVNHGLIQAASGGSVALVGGSVANDGVILANYGSINLDGAEHAVLDFDGNGLINIQITGELKQRLDDKEAAVSNSGTLKAEGGTVVLQASAAKDLFTNLVNNSGVIDASGISTDGGVVRLVGNGGNVQSSGSVIATGDHGGRIELLSDHDVMVTGGTVDASGRRGGGAIRVGGGVRGGEGLAVAARTYIGPDASLNADATGKGDGGSIAVFSRDNSVIAGGLSARGGIDGGNGGFVETSSHGALTITGTPQVFARSADGLGGNWLIDPNNITIVAGSGNTKINAANPFVSTNDGASLGVDLITAALTGGASVTVTTGTGGANSEAGDITLNADLDYNGKGTNSLTFNAANDIVINNKIFDSVLGGDVLNLSLLAGRNISLNNDISLGGGTATLTATAGSISRTAGTISGSALTLTAGGTNGAIGASGAIQTDVDSIVFSAKGTGAVNIVDANGVNVSGTAGSGNVGITTTTSDLGVVGSGIVTAGGAVTLGAAGGGARINIGTGVAVDTTNGVATGANVSLVADNVDILGTINAGTAGIVAIRQATAGRLISLGPDAPFPADPQLGVTSAELDQITANTIVIGDANSGDLGITAAIAPAHATTLSLNTGGTISQVGGATITVGTLTGSSAGATTLGEANQIGNLGSFTASSFSLTNAAALTLVGNVTTSGAQTYNTALVLGGDRVLSGSDITFASTVDGAHALTVNASGVTRFDAAVGGTTALTSLITDAAGSATLSGNVATSGMQSWGDALTLGSNVMLTGTTISLAAVTGAGNNLTVTGNAVLAGAVAGVGVLQVSGTTNLNTASVSTSGDQAYNGSVTLGANATLASSGSGTIGFGSTVNGAHTLAVNTGGAASFGGAVGATTALTSLTTNSGTFSAVDLTVNGPLSVTTTAGGITQGAGFYTVNGTSTFNAGSNAITLTSLNDFIGTVSLTGGTTQITDANALALGTLQTGSLTVSSGGALDLGHGSVAGDLSATSGTSITLNGALAGLGNVAFSGSAPSGTGSIAGTGSITGIGGSPFALVGANQGTSGGISFTGFIAADATAVTGAAGFDDASKVSQGMTFVNATSVGGSGTIANVVGSFADNTGTSSASGIVYSGFDAVTGTGGSVTGVTGSFNLGTKVSSASTLDYSGFGVTTLTGSGAGATIAGSGQTYTLDNTVIDQGSSGGVTWTGFGNIADTSGTVAFGTGGSVSGNVTAATLNYGSHSGAVTFDLADGSGATTGIGGTWAGVTAVTGNGNGAITGSSTFALSGANAGSAGGVAFTGFTAADAATITGAAGFNSAAKSSLGMTFANATSVAGSGAITNLGGTAFNLSGTKTGNAGGVGYSGFTAADTTTVTGAAGFDDASKVSQGMTFVNATSVGGSGTIANVVGSFADNTGTSSASGIVYSGFDAVTGTGGSVTGVTGSFNLGTKVSSASTLDYSGFGVTTLTGSGAGATIAGSGQTYTLDNTVIDQGSSGGVTWTGFGNIADTSGTVAFGTGGSVSGNVTAATLNYGSHSGAVTFDLADGSGATTGIGGTWAGVTAVTGNGNGAITGSSTFALSGANAGSAGGVAFTGFTAADAATITGAAGFDDIAKTSQGMTFVNATSVGGSGTIANVVGSFADNTGTSSASGIVYSGFDAVTGTGGSVTGVTGSFNLGTKVSSASTLDYSGFGVTTLTGSGAGATIAGSGQTYTLDNTVIDQGSSGGVTWMGFGNIADTSGTVAFGTGGSVSGNVTAATLNYGSHSGAVTFDLADGSGATTGIGGTWAGVTAVTGNGNGAITGSSTFALSGANAGSAGGVAFTGFTAADAATITGAAGFNSAAKSSLGMTFANATSVAGSGAITNLGGTAFNLSGTKTGNAGGVGYSGFTAADTTTVTGAVGFDSSARSSLGMTFANATSVAGSGAITNLGSTAFNLTGTTAGNAGGIDYNGFTSADTTTVTGAAGFDYTAKTSLGMAFANATSVAGSGAITNLGSTAFNLTGIMAGTAGTTSFNGFDAADTTAVTGAAGFDSSTRSSLGIAFANATSVAGSGAITNLGGTAFNLVGTKTGNAGGVNYSGFTAADTTSVTGAAGFDSAAKSSLGMTFANATSVAGSGAITNLGGTAFNLSGTKTGNAGGVGYSGFTAADTTTVTGAVGFDDNGRTSEGMAFANATSVGGSGSIANVVGSFADNTRISSASGIAYSGFGTVTGTGGSVTGVTGSFDLGTKVSSASGIDYSGFNLTTLAGSGAGATIAGSNQTYNLTGTDAGNNGTLSWTSFGNLSDSGAGTFMFANGAGVSGMLTSAAAGTLDYSAYTTAVNVDLGGTATGTGGWSGITAAKGGSASDTISGSSQTYNLTGLNAGNSGTVSWTSFENIADAGIGTLTASNQTWSLTGHNQGTATNLAGAFSGIGNLIDTGTGHFLMHSGADGDISGGLDAGIDGSLDYSGYTTAVNVNLAGAGSTGVGGTNSGISAVTASSNLGISGNASNGLTITTTGAGTTTTLGATTVGGDLNITASGAVLQTGGALSVIGTSTIHGGSNAITLTGGSNDFGGTVNLTGGATQINDLNALTLGTVNTGALTVSAGDLTLAGAVNGTAVSLTSSGAISEGAGGSLTATSLTGHSAGTTTLAGTNHIGSLGSFSAAGFALINAQALTVNGPVSGGAGTALTTTAGNLTINGAVSGTTTTLNSAGGISEGGSGSITAGTLRGQSIGATALNGANHIGTLGSFSAAGFALTNAQTLVVGGTVDGGASTALTTTSGDLAINGLVKGATTTLVSAGAITEGAGGSITANLLTGHSIGNTTLDGNNHINILGGFSADFSLTNGQTLTVEGPLDGGPVVALTTTAGDLIINGTVTGATTTLTSAGAIIEGTHGVITADNLTGSSAGSTSLLGANQVAALGAFVSGGDFAFNTIRTLTVNDAPSANGGAGDLTLTASGANSDLILASTLTGNTVTLGAGRNINQTAGAIHANTLTGSSVGSTALGGANHIGTLGNFTAANFALTNAQALAVTGSVDGGASTTLKTTSGNLAINGTVKGTTTTLASAGAITEGAGGSIVAGMLTGSSAGATTLNGANRIGTLGGFTAASFALTNAQTLAVSGTLDGGASTSLKTTSGDLAINGPVKGTATSLTSAGAISEGAAGVITAGTLTGSSVGATTLNGANQIGTLGSFTAANFALTSAQALTVDGPLDGGASTSLKTTSGDLAINGSVKGTATSLTSAGAISEGASGIITAGTLSGSAVGPTVLGSASSPNKNMVDTLGNFTSLAGFSMTNDKTLTLASVAGSAFTVNAGTSPFYLSVTHGDLFQLGTTPLYDGIGVWGSTGRLGSSSQPIYVVGTGLQNIANVGLPPAYFYAVDSSGNLLPLGGGFAINVPTASGAGSAQNGNHGDSYIDPSVITANYRSYGIVPSGVRLPPDQQSGCDPDQPDQAACQDPDALGMVMPWPKAPQ
ncbi:filamentous hemagglutinin N-terminal domain-containing protein [Rhodanobacter sp. UC4437_H4]